MRTEQRSRSSGSRVPVVAARTVAGVGWLAAGLAAAWLVVATPLLVRSTRFDAGYGAAPFLGGLAWAAALTAPTCLVLLGVLRLASAAANLRGRTRPFRPVHAMAGRLPAGLLAFPTIRLPDGRQIPDVVLGPHGIAFFEMLPPPGTSRHVGSHWEARGADGAWRPIENPLERAARDADGLRRFLEAADCGFVVRVHAAVMPGAGSGVLTVERTGACSVVPLGEVPGWLTALPVQRSLTLSRLQRVGEILEGLAAA